MTFVLMITKAFAWMTLAGLLRSTANTDVTFGLPSASRKHEPGMIRFCGTAQSAVDGEADIITGARWPRSISTICVSVKVPKILLSPSVTVRLITTFALPPQQASGNGVPGNCGPSAGSVARTNSGLMIVTSLSGIINSGTPSALVSQTMLIEAGRKLQLMKLIVTSQRALMMPTVECGSGTG